MFHGASRWLPQIVIPYTAIRYITAAIGAIFIFAAVFILTALLVPALPPVFRMPVNLGLFYTNNIFGAALAALAATASFRATLRRAKIKDLKKARQGNETV